MSDAQSTPETDAPRRRLPVRKRLLFAALLTLLGLGVVYAGSVVQRARRPYGILKDVSAGWSASVHHADAELGYATTPNAAADFLFFDGVPVPTRHDARGFRAPVDAAAGAPGRPLTLALGGSYTYGYGCRAEETFPYRVAADLGGDAINAGVSGYGLAQMLLLARRLIPEYAPDYVLVQYSPWLVLRARHPFAPTSIGRWPVPFFAVDGTGALRLRPPLFRARILDLPAFEYRHAHGGRREFASFVQRVAFPLFAYEDAHMLRAVVDGSLRQADMRRDLRRDIDWPYRPPTDDSDVRVVQAVYEEIEALCRAAGARMVIVVLSKYQRPESHLRILRALPLAVLIDAPVALYDRLPEPTVPAYNRAYCHWRGTPPGFADPHPNPLAHEIIAGEIVRAIRLPKLPL